MIYREDQNFGINKVFLPDVGDVILLATKLNRIVASNLFIPEQNRNENNCETRGDNVFEHISVLKVISQL